MTGLNCNFNLDGGKFLLSSGKEKARDAIWFYCVFDKYRVYDSAFRSNFILLLQKPVSTIIMNRTIILGLLRKGIEKYVPSVEVKKIDLGTLPNDRKSLVALLEYNTIDTDNLKNSPDVIFI